MRKIELNVCKKQKKTGISFFTIAQGDTLAPYLFAIVVDFAMRQAIRNNEEELGLTIQTSRSRRHPAVCITDLMFADDIALLSEEIAQAQELLSCVEMEA